MLADCRELVRCMAVSKSWRAQACLVDRVSLAWSRPLRTYWDKVRVMVQALKPFTALRELKVRMGEAQAEDSQPWARCMRYAEIGSYVNKFVFLAAKNGDRDFFATDAATHARDGQAQIQDLGLKQVIGPNDESLKKMVPVIVFAIIGGFDEFRHAIPPFLLRFAQLESLLFVDVAESVTIFLRGHHLAQLRPMAAGAQALSAELQCRLAGASSGRLESLAGAEDTWQGTTSAGPPLCTGRAFSAEAMSVRPAVAGTETSEAGRAGPQLGSLASASASLSATPENRAAQAATVQTAISTSRAAKAAAPNFDISFWRADQVRWGPLALADVSICIATCDAVPLAEAEVAELARSAVAGPLLATMIDHVNQKQPSMQQL
eukprot:SM000524S17506  [mRNA]  locus=s524:92:1978:+ [translate_table: standard]